MIYVMSHLQNIMEFKKASVDGKAYGDCYDGSGNVIENPEVYIFISVI